MSFLNQRVPRRDLKGQIFTLTVAEFRSAPGAALDAVCDGATVQITRRGSPIAKIVSYDTRIEGETTVVMPDGSFIGPAPLTKGLPELLG